MTNLQARVPVAESIRAALPGMAFAAPFAGEWRLGNESARWRLEAEGSGFWLVLSVPLDGTTVELLELLRRAGGYACPLKPTRSSPGAAVARQIEVRLSGARGDAARIARAAGIMSGVCRSAAAAERPKAEAPPANVPDWQAIVREALGGSVVSVREQVLRVPVSARSLSVELTGTSDGLGGRVVLAHRFDPRSVDPATVAAIADFLLGANARFPGARLVIADQGEAAIVLETVADGDDLTAGAIRDRVQRLERIAAAVQPALRWLLESADAGAVYSEYLFAETPSAAPA